MLQSAQFLCKFRIKAKDETIGSVADLYYDDQSWAIRHIVVDTGNWLSGRQVLISPQAVILPVDRNDETWADWKIPVAITADRVRNSPDVFSDLPISKQEEIKLFSYYNWVPYWGMEGGMYPLPAAVSPPDTRDNDAIGNLDEKSNSHLRSIREVDGYHIQALDGEIGHAEDCIVDVDTWLIRYFVINTRNWLPGRRVLVSTEWIESVDWATKRVTVNLQRETIKKCPDCDHSKMIHRGYEEQLHDHYGRAGYWLKGGD